MINERIYFSGLSVSGEEHDKIADDLLRILGQPAIFLHNPLTLSFRSSLIHLPFLTKNL